MKSLLKDNRGASKVVIIAIIVAVAVAAFAGWWFLLKDKNKSETQKAAEKVAEQIEATCTNPDKNICKFYAASAKSMNNVSMVTTSTDTDGKTTTTEFNIDGDKSYMKLDNYEVIYIDQTSYTKGGNTWWRQTTKTDTQTDAENNKDSVTYKDESDKPEADRTQYKLIGEEACGNLNCYKYQVIKPGGDTSGTTEYIWFDTKDYLIRKQTTEGIGGKTETTFTYGTVKISEPSPVKDIPEGQYLMPGATEPTANPAAGLDQQ